MRPEHGGRLELKLIEATDTTARYAVLVSTAAAEVSAQAHVQTQSGAVEIGAWTEIAAPAWLEAFARTLLRAALRNKTSDGEWPRRMTRWRPEPPVRGSDPAD
ncbi:MAG: hypothetical protein ABI627_31240 [Polyangiaceae bacterium]